MLFFYVVQRINFALIGLSAYISCINPKKSIIMKNTYLLVASLFLCILFGCTQDQLTDEQRISERKTKKPIVQLPSDPITDTGEHCFYTNLIAGQHYVAGSVTVDIVGDNLIITYTTNGDWTLGITHLSIGNCDEDWAPLTGSGNPQIGQFEYTEPFSSGPHEVVYVISLEGLDDNFCFAAHAEVVGPNGGETAWAQGTQFSGRSWAMFAELNLSDCDSGNDDGGGDPNQPT